MRGHLLLMLQIVLFAFAAHAQSVEKEGKTTISRRTGFVTARLSVRELEKWQKIEKVVFAENDSRQPLHPTLRNMWQWIETSGHTVYVDIVNWRGRVNCIAGEFKIEKFDPLGERHVAVIKLNLASIKQAYVGHRTRRANGFIPFLDLNKEERYAEVLGHELAHAVHILTSLERARRVEELIEQTNELLLLQSYPQKGSLGADLNRRVTNRDALLKELEEQAENMEKVVWEELVSRKSGKGRVLYLADK